MQVRYWISVPFLMVLAACSAGPQTAPVKGTVTFEGKPVADGKIRFEADGGRSATGKIVDGQIVEVTTIQPNDGAPVGVHKIAIWAFAEAPGAAKPDQTDFSYMGGKSLIDASYNNPETSGFTADIKPGVVNTLELKLVAK